MTSPVSKSVQERLEDAKANARVRIFNEKVTISDRVGERGDVRPNDEEQARLDRLRQAEDEIDKAKTQREVEDIERRLLDERDLDDVLDELRRELDSEDLPDDRDLLAGMLGGGDEPSGDPVGGLGPSSPDGPDDPAGGGDGGMAGGSSGDGGSDGGMAGGSSGDGGSGGEGGSGGGVAARASTDAGDTPGSLRGRLRTNPRALMLSEVLMRRLGNVTDPADAGNGMPGDSGFGPAGADPSQPSDIAGGPRAPRDRDRFVRPGSDPRVTDPADDL